MVERDFVKPLHEDLCTRVEGYAQTDCIENASTRAFVRFQLLIIANEAVNQQGDSLTLEWDGFCITTYAGKLLGEKQYDMRLDTYELFEHYQPLIYGGVNVGARVSSREENGETVFDSETHQFLTTRRDEYESLPPAFKVALVARYINENVIADSEAVVRFVLNCGNVTPQRWMARYTFSHDLLRNGWAIRLRDVEPPVNLGGLIASKLKASTESVLAAEQPNHVVKTEKDKPRRAGDERTYKMAVFVAGLLDDAESKGVRPPTADEIKAKYETSGLVTKNYGSGHSLMTAFDQYISNRPELANKHPGVKKRLEQKAAHKAKREGR